MVFDSLSVESIRNLQCESRKLHFARFAIYKLLLLVVVIVVLLVYFNCFWHE